MSLIPLHAVVLLCRNNQLYCRESPGLNAFIKEKETFQFVL